MNSSNINIPKKILDLLDPDEKVVYVAEGHWCNYLLCLICLLAAIISFINHYIIVFLISSLFFIGIFFSLDEKIVITNKRILQVSKLTPYLFDFETIRQKRTFDKIKYASSYENWIGVGTLHLEHRDYPQNMFMNWVGFKNVKDLEFVINDELRHFNNQSFDKFNGNYKKAKSSNKYKTILIFIVSILLQIFLLIWGLKDFRIIVLFIFSIYLTYSRMFKRSS